MDALQACAAALGLFYSRRALDDPIYIQKAVVRLLAKIPTMVAAFQLKSVKETNPVSSPGMIWTMPPTFSTCWERKSTRPPLAAKLIFDICLTLHAEHTINASTLFGHGNGLYPNGPLCR